MLDCLYNLSNNILILKNYISDIEKLNTILSFGLKQPLLGVEKLINDYKDHCDIANKKVFDYKTIIISLYGYFENFIESAIREYLTKLSGLIPDYKDLPDKIKNNHVDLSAELIKNLRLQKYQGCTTKEEIIGNLNTCINIGQGYKLNLDAYTYHTSNFKHENINEFFSSVGINNISNNVKQNPQFCQYLCNLLSVKAINGLSDSLIFEKLNDLAIRRNEISHGSTSNIISIDLLKEYVEYISIYCCCISDLIFKELILYYIKSKAIKIDKVIQIIRRKILCVEVENIKLTKEDVIIANTTTVPGHYQYSKIVNIQENNINYDSIDIKGSKQIGIELDFTVKCNQEFWLLKL